MHKPQIRLSRRAELCTAAELRLVESSRRQALAELTAAQVKKKIAQARKLRDKWRDLSNRQRRLVQREQQTRERRRMPSSQQKSQLFVEVLARFEARLESLAASPADAVRSKKPAGSRPSKCHRVRGHRQARSLTRRQLTEVRAVLESHGAQPEQSPPAVVSEAARCTGNRGRVARPPDQEDSGQEGQVAGAGRADEDPYRPGPLRAARVNGGRQTRPDQSQRTGYPHAWARVGSRQTLASEP